MADGDTVTVALIAKVDDLVSGLAEATAAMRDTAAGMSGGFKATGEAAHKHDELMHEVLSGALFLEFKEIATEALEAVKESFEKTVGAAEEFGLSNEKFSRMMHVSETDAAAMSAALKGVGSSAGAYESISLRLQKTLENSKKINADLANAMKGPNGEALSGAALMDRLKDYRLVLHCSGFGGEPNVDIRMGDTRPVDLTREPFNLPARRVLTYGGGYTVQLLERGK